MKTLILRAGHGIEHAADILKRGGICIIPTETVYGLACDATNTAALARLRHLKGRQPDKPFSILMSAPPRGIGADIDRLAGVYMPGPLTLVLPRAALEAAIDTGATANLVDAVASPMSLDSSATSDSIGMRVPANSIGMRVPADSIGVRVPSHDTTLSLLRVCGFPLAAPSANRAGEAPPVTFEDALRRFDGMIECAIDGGDCARGVESTVLDMTQPTPRMLRRGAITKRAIENTLGRAVSGMTVVGITGGTGAGKTTALGVLRELGAEIIDCDEVYHTLLTRPDMLDELKARFPAAFTNGVFDRKALGEIVFHDAGELEALNAITHARVGREVDRRLREYEKLNVKLAAVDAIALIESSRAEMCDLTVAVTAPTEVRVRRITARDGISEEYARARISKQKPDEFYRAGCDAVLENDGDEQEFRRRCRAFFTARLGV